ncbi:Fic family protein [Prevotella nigrescens]|uniref:Fic family protein n=1 Tax=Prevotella nigrescens TaxID=28133 RepID=UPI002880819A|nr:Fic family protein [Prevotella nigrescens]
MIESTPKQQNTSIQLAFKLLNNQQYKELFDKIDDNYLYWDKVKYLSPDGIRPEVLWNAVKIRRSTNVINLKFGKYIFHFTITKRMQALLYEFDTDFSNHLNAENIIPDKDSKQYLVSSIMEEAIASSQMEGASTTRKVAKEILRQQKNPVDKSQQMIVNNYATIRYLLDNKTEKMTLDYLKKIHQSISNKTLDSSESEGKLRKDNNIYVMNNITGEITHTPPDVSELPELLKELCDFANDKSDLPFIHPIVKGIIIHFMLAFFHPFVDGNGRTSRALVYWYLLKRGYWLTEYLSISRIIYKSKTQYEKSFLYTENDDLDLSYFINYNLVVLKKAYEDLRTYLQKKIREQKELLTLIGIAEINERQVQIIKALDETPASIFTAKELTNRFGITAKTARNDLQGLVTIGLMVTSPMNKRKIGYLRSRNFDEILKALINRKE